MENKILYVLMAVGALLLLSTGLVYAHGDNFLQGSSDQETSFNFDEMHNMMAGDDTSHSKFMDVQNFDEFDMDKMYQLMSANVDPGLKDEFDVMHEECLNHFKNK